MLVDKIQIFIKYMRYSFLHFNILHLIYYIQDWFSFYKKSIFYNFKISLKIFDYLNF